MAKVKDIDTSSVVYFDRHTFINDVWDYHTGDHVTILGPTGSGKTQFGYELVGATSTPKVPAVILVMKPRDPTITKFTKQYKFSTVRDWPPPKIKGVFTAKPNGYVLWPRGTGNLEADDAKQVAIFRRAIQDNYRKGDRITFADETYSLEKEMGLSQDLNRVWTKGRSMDNGLWAASQRPRWISMWAYQAQHLFLANDPDEATQKRYGEIGAGIDPELVRALTAKLKRYEFLYINRDERTICIVGA